MTRHIGLLCSFENYTICFVSKCKMFLSVFDPNLSNPSPSLALGEENYPCFERWPL